MSKNLETEYKNLVNTDIPDLWARIEAALPEKTIQNGNATNSDNLINFSTGNVNSKEDPVQFRHIKKSYNDQLSGSATGKKKRRKKVNYALISSIAVACLAIGIMIPVLISTKKADKENDRERVRNEAATVDWSVQNSNPKEEMEMAFTSEETYEAADYEEYDGYEENSVEAQGAASFEVDKNSDHTVTDTVKSESLVSTDKFKAVVDIVAVLYDEENEMSYYGVVLVPNNGLSSGEHVVLYPSEERFEHYQELQEIEMVLQYVETNEYGEKAFIICDVLTVK